MVAHWAFKRFRRGKTVTGTFAPSVRLVFVRQCRRAESLAPRKELLAHKALKLAYFRMRWHTGPLSDGTQGLLKLHNVCMRRLNQKRDSRTFKSIQCSRTDTHTHTNTHTQSHTTTHTHTHTHAHNQSNTHKHTITHKHTRTQTQSKPHPHATHTNT